MNTTKGIPADELHALTHIPLVEEDDAAGSVAAVYADYRSRYGRSHVPGILKCFATHPPLLEQMFALASSLLFVDGHLNRRTKEMIATHVSVLNACSYCLDSHASFLQQQGGSDELLLALFTGNPTHPAIGAQERVLLNFVAKVSDESYKVCAADIQSLEDAGWHRQQIAETIHITALFACFNRVANAFGLPSQNLFRLNPAHICKENS